MNKEDWELLNNTFSDEGGKGSIGLIPLKLNDKKQMEELIQALKLYSKEVPEKLLLNSNLVVLSNNFKDFEGYNQWCLSTACADKNGNYCFIVPHESGQLDYWVFLSDQERPMFAYFDYLENQNTGKYNFTKTDLEFFEKAGEFFEQFENFRERREYLEL